MKTYNSEIEVNVVYNYSTFNSSEEHDNIIEKIIESIKKCFNEILIEHNKHEVKLKGIHFCSNSHGYKGTKSNIDLTETTTIYIDVAYNIDCCHDCDETTVINSECSECSNYEDIYDKHILIIDGDLQATFEEYICSMFERISGVEQYRL
jgi:hypothetical protein